MTKPRDTKAERFLNRLQTYRFLWPVIVFGIIVIALGNFTDALDRIISFLGRFSSRQQEQRMQPTFSEKLDSAYFFLGEHGIGVGVPRSDLELKRRATIFSCRRGSVRTFEPFDLNGFKPVKVYVADATLYADVEIYGGSGIPPIKVVKNQLVDRPRGWEMNSNDRALEVVNEAGAAVYQLYYKSASEVVFNGVFPYPGGLILASNSGVLYNPRLPTTFTLNRIFKYPTWKYPGQMDENAPPTTIVLSSVTR